MRTRLKKNDKNTFCSSSSAQGTYITSKLMFLPTKYTANFSGSQPRAYTGFYKHLTLYVYPYRTLDQPQRTKSKRAPQREAHGAHSYIHTHNSLSLNYPRRKDRARARGQSEFRRLANTHIDPHTCTAEAFVTALPPSWDAGASSITIRKEAGRLCGLI